MRRKVAAKVASAAVTHTQLAVEDELGWLFRAQPTEDYGIDAHAEVVDGEDVRGRLLALQIKGGVSWFGEPCPGGWWFRPADKHVQYWTNHSLPVVVVLYHPETGRCHWQLVSQKTLVATSTGAWKLRVPAVNVLGATARATLQEAAEGAAGMQRTWSPGSKRLTARRRAIVLGGLAAAASAAVPTALILSRPRPRSQSRPRPSGAAGPVIITDCRIFTEDGVVNTVAFNPQDGTLASGTDKGIVRLRNCATRRQVGVIDTKAQVASITFSPDGKTLAIGGGTDNEPMARLWDIASGHVTILRGQQTQVSSVAFSRDGRFLASGSPSNWVNVWDAAGRHSSGFFAYNPVYSVALNQDGTTLALGGGHHRDGTAQLRTLPAGTEFDVMPGHAGLFESVAFSLNGDILACGSEDHAIRLWHPDSGRVAILKGHAGVVWSVAFSPQGNTLASGSTDKMVRLWDVTTRAPIAIFRGHAHGVESVAFSPDGKTLASGGDDSSVRVWKIP